MTKTRIQKTAGLFACIAFSGSMSVAAPSVTAPIHIRGVIESFKGSDLTVSTPNGPNLVVIEPADGVAAVLPSERSHIQPGVFAGIASVLVGKNGVVPPM